MIDDPAKLTAMLRAPHFAFLDRLKTVPDPTEEPARYGRWWGEVSPCRRFPERRMASAAL